MGEFLIKLNLRVSFFCNKFQILVWTKQIKANMYIEYGVPLMKAFQLHKIKANHFKYIVGPGTNTAEFVAHAAHGVSVKFFNWEEFFPIEYV